MELVESWKMTTFSLRFSVSTDEYSVSYFLSSARVIEPLLHLSGRERIVLDLDHGVAAGKEACEFSEAAHRCRARTQDLDTVSLFGY